MVSQNRKVVFQASIYSCELFVSGRADGATECWTSSNMFKEAVLDEDNLYTVTLILHTWPKDLEIGTSPAESGFLVKMEMLEWLVPWNLRRSFGTICLGLQSGAKITKLHKAYDSLKISKGILKDSKT